MHRTVQRSARRGRTQRADSIIPQPVCFARKGNSMIDTHVHPGIGSVGTRGILQYMDKYGVDAAWLLSHENAGTVDVAAEGAPILNCEVWDAYKQDPQRFIPGFTVIPGEAAVERRVEKCIQLGFRLFGEFKICNGQFDSPACQRIYDVLADFGVPLLFHMGALGFSESDLEPFRRMFGKYRRLTFIAHSMGWWKHISRNYVMEINYPSGPIEQPGELIGLLDEYPNLLANLDMIEGVNALARDPSFSRRFLSAYRSRLLYGSDFPIELYEGRADFRWQRLWRDCLLLRADGREELPKGYRELLEQFEDDPGLVRDVFHENGLRLIPKAKEG